jgi:hypothetical protein
MRDVVLFLRNDNLYEKRMDALLQTKIFAQTTMDTIYRLSFDFNPLTKAYIYTESTDPKKEKLVSQDKAYFLELLRRFAPNYKQVVDTNYCGPGCYYSLVGNERKVPSKDTTNDRLLSSFNTMVHETTHHFNSGSYLLIDPEIVIQFPSIKTYHSQEFLPLVPEEAKTRIFRYTTYVSPGSGVSANLSGICGIMDEFSAYRNGTKASLDAALSAKAQGNEKRTLDFLNEALPTYFAYYEFRIFISWYLEYGAKHKPDLHKELMANTNFRIAFTLLEQGFQDDIKIMEKMVKENPSVKWRYDSYEKEDAIYCKELLKKQEKILSSFRIPGVTKANYKSFLVAQE